MWGALQSPQIIKFIFMFCLHICRFVARAVLWKVFAWSASAALLFSSTSVLSMLASMTSTFSCLRGCEGRVWRAASVAASARHSCSNDA